MNHHKFLFICFCMVFFCGCVPLNSREITGLKGEVSQLQIEYRELKQKQSDLYASMDSSIGSIESLKILVQELQNKISVLNQTIKDFESNIDKKANGKITVSLLPSSVYQSSYGDYSMGKYDLAYSGFQSFVEKYPNSELAPQAQFYMGECFYSRSMWEDALKEYRKVEVNYGKSDIVSSVRLKMALCYEMLGMKKEAISTFSSILRDFPRSPEALTARDKIKAYNNVQAK